MKLKPLGNRIIVEPITEQETTKSGIILPDTVDKERPEKGRVVAVGPGKLNEDGKRVQLEIKKGQVVLFKKYGPDEIKVGDKEYYIIKEENILAVLE